MTPQEIFEYKQRWMSSGNNNPVRLHSDLTDSAKTWCRRNLDRQSWGMSTWTGVYEHTFYFENVDASADFKTEFSKYVVDDFDVEDPDPDKRSWYYDSYGVKRKKNQ